MGFQATENSISFWNRVERSEWVSRTRFVIDRGANWSVEMLDYGQSETRHIAVAELRTQLSFPMFDEILVNTRSHTQLAASMADGDEGLKPIAHYQRQGKQYDHLGIDRAFAPRSLAREPRIRELTIDQEGIERITTWQHEEWQGERESSESPFVWRFERNRAVAAGVKLLLRDLENTFPDTRIRVVIPPRADAVQRVRNGLDSLPMPGGGVYGQEYYRHLRSSLNYMPVVGGGMAMIDLSDLQVEPVFLGVRFMPPIGPLQLYLRECLADMRGNHSSNFHGPRSFFYEAQETLRTTDSVAARRNRERIICELLAHSADINEIILYEAADWVYKFPLDDADLCGHGFLDRCPPGEQ
jgi:hypothetical protein